MTGRGRAIRSELIRAVAGFGLLPHRARPKLLRFAGVDVGSGSLILSGLELTGGARVSVGPRCFINRSVFIEAAADVTIGMDVQIANHVRITTSTHEIGPAERRAGKSVAEQVTIEDGTWVGMGVTILPGVTIARGCVIAAGAIVAKDTLPNGLYAGVPARRVRELY